ncbi:MAG: hypothetical protein H0T89_16765 [Deltaproteobacteria bacterium]|nr:hypothetical protein [Deltaproteobacteria bacterium]MDQ3296119.1 hypothetical protein [Myxococcota bacterium]
MTRSTVLLAILLAGACSVGEVDLGGGGDGGTGDGTSAVERDTCAPLGTPGTAHNHTLSGANPAGPRSGAGCLGAGCHGVVEPGSSRFAFAGTAYKDTGGATVAPGATIRVFKRGEKVVLGKAVTDTAGNFYITGNFTAFPYEVDVTACGSTPSDIIPMIAPINSPGEANCSSSGNCHAIPGTRAIYIP